MKNIYLLPTDKSSSLAKFHDDYLQIDHDDFKGYDQSCIQRQHIYITSEEKLNDGWCICEYVDGTVSCNKLELSGGFNKYKIILTTDPELIADGVQAIDDSFLEWFVKNPSCEEVEVYLKGETIRGYHTVPKEQIASIYLKHQIIIPKPDFSDSLGSIISTISLAQDMFGVKEETVEEAARLHAKLKDNFDLEDESYYNSTAINAYNSFIEGAKWQELRNSSK